MAFCFAFTEPGERGAANLPRRASLRWASTGLTFVAVNAGWAFFCMDTATAVQFYRRLASRVARRCHEICRWNYSNISAASGTFRRKARPPWSLLFCVRSLTWILFLALIYAFCGQSSKFIYIDF